MATKISHSSTSTSSNEASTDENKIKRRALLIGNNYYGRDDTLLGAPIVDLTTMRSCVKKIMPDTEGVETQIETLKDEKYEGMKDAMAAISDGLGENDELLFYYSGHGNCRKTDNDDTTDTKESTLVPVDVAHDYSEKSKEQNREISRGMLLGWAKQNLDKGVKMRIIIDSCLAGGLLPTTQSRGTNESCTFSPDKRKKKDQYRPTDWICEEANGNEDCFKHKDFGMIMACKAFESPTLFKRNNVTCSKLTYYFDQILDLCPTCIQAEDMSLTHISDVLCHRLYKVERENPEIFFGNPSSNNIFFNKNGGNSPNYHHLAVLKSKTKIQFRSLSIFSHVTVGSTFELYEIEDIKMEKPMVIEIKGVVKKHETEDNDGVQALICTLVLATFDLVQAQSSFLCFSKYPPKNFIMRAVKKGENDNAMLNDKNLNVKYSQSLDWTLALESKSPPVLKVTIPGPKRNFLLCFVEISQDDSLRYHGHHFCRTNTEEGTAIIDELSGENTPNPKYKVFIFEFLREVVDDATLRLSTGELADAFENDITMKRRANNTIRPHLQDQAYYEKSNATRGKNRHLRVNNWACKCIC